MRDVEVPGGLERLLLAGIVFLDDFAIDDDFDGGQGLIGECHHLERNASACWTERDFAPRFDVFPRAAPGPTLSSIVSDAS